MLGGKTLSFEALAWKLTKQKNQPCRVGSFDDLTPKNGDSLIHVVNRSQIISSPRTSQGPSAAHGFDRCLKTALSRANLGFAFTGDRFNRGVSVTVSGSFGHSFGEFWSQFGYRIGEFRSQIRVVSH
jgi:hypothetical protein